MSLFFYIGMYNLAKTWWLNNDAMNSFKKETSIVDAWVSILYDKLHNLAESCKIIES